MMFKKIGKISLLCLFFLLVIEARTTYKYADLPEEFIIGGIPPNIDLEHVALIVSLLDTPTEYGWLFTGTLITPQHILTVAQAARGFYRWKVGLGNINRLMMTFYTAASATIHPNFNPVNLNNNLAILLLTQSIPEAIATPVQLPPENLAPSAAYLYYGFGTTDPTSADHLPNILQQAVAVEMTLDECREAYGNQLITDATWCSQPAPNAGLCYGDQGGPLVHFLDHYLVAIASFWMPPCNSNHPNVFVRISHYRQWINETVGWPVEV